RRPRRARARQACRSDPGARRRRRADGAPRMDGRGAGGMSWLVDTRRYADGRPDAIGPGRLILVVGASGAGKDTLISGARPACAGDPSVVFPRRTVTRRSTAAEDHDTMPAEDFRHAVAAGRFALWWEAHGHSYGIPASVDDDIRASRTVVCNVSRTIVGFARI